jgi:hypothetical protein
MTAQLIVFFLLALTGGCSPHPAVQAEEIIWDQKRRLSWDDFTKRTGHAGVFKAFTTAGMRYAIEAPTGEIEITTETYFLPKESWVHIDFQRDDLLAHEQAHFDIAAIYGRKLAVELAALQVDVKTFIERDYGQRADAIFDELYNELQATQTRYDKETEHGINTDAQQKWVQWIANQLAESN